MSAAEAEWARWGSSSWNLVTGDLRIGHVDDEAPFAQLVIDDYCAVGGGSPTPEAISNDDYAWSAVCISAIMKHAGFSRAEFPFAQSHSTWIIRFVKARKAGDTAVAYWGFRVTEPEAAPEVGDIVAYARKPGGISFEEAQAFFDRTTPYTSHSDLVVARRAREIDVIGGNVKDSVTRKTLPLDHRGLLADRRHPWFVVLKKR